jgi:hypothetical protein
MDLIKIIVGGLLLALGRKLYWLFVAAVGFAVGLALAGRLFQGSPEWVMILAGLLLGLLGALLAKFFQKLALGIAGFAAGAWIVQALLSKSEGSSTPLILGLALVGGIIGAVLVTAAFDWALIFLSAAAGSLLIAQSLPIEGLGNWFVILVLFILGIFLQLGLRESGRRRYGKSS